jgi:hypothetical protein
MQEIETEIAGIERRICCRHTNGSLGFSRRLHSRSSVKARQSWALSELSALRTVRANGRKCRNKRHAGGTIRSQMDFKISYIKEALKEPINIGGLLLAGAAAAYAATTGTIEPTLILAAGS